MPNATRQNEPVPCAVPRRAARLGSDSQRYRQPEHITNKKQPLPPVSPHTLLQASHIITAKRYVHTFRFAGTDPRLANDMGGGVGVQLSALQPVNFNVTYGIKYRVRSNAF
jgi:hypothetical protein